MLILSRRHDEVVELHRDGRLIGRVTVIKLKGDCARLGFEFPADVVLSRSLVPFAQLPPFNKEDPDGQAKPKARP